ncbi:hypothetical protein DHX103_02700 [Planococcus sp. X10-3]|uniref:hypothetical protein n=1 Tax=Planococcus sp. X10-3 TaxID=3061240 RepID=UPI003BAFB77E
MESKISTAPIGAVLIYIRKAQPRQAPNFGQRKTPATSGRRFSYTKGMGEMFTLKQRGVCLYVIYFTRLTLSRNNCLCNNSQTNSQICHNGNQPEMFLIILE